MTSLYYVTFSLVIMRGVRIISAIRSLLFVALLGLFISGCGVSAKPVSTLSTESMKGYELYSWQEGTQWNFSLLIGTNREKSLEEIKSAENILDFDALKTALEKIQAGQYITWYIKETLSFPPDDIIQQVEQICKDQGLILNIAK